MKAVVVNPEGTGVEIVANKDMRPLETGKLLFKSNTVVSATLTSLHTGTSVKFQAVFLDTKELVLSRTCSRCQKPQSWGSCQCRLVLRRMWNL